MRILFHALMAIALLGITQMALAQPADLSGCDNCDVFPPEWMEVAPDRLLPLDDTPPARQLDFLIGEWDIYFPYKTEGDPEYIPRDAPVATETFEWMVDQRIIHGFQQWNGEGGYVAHTDMRYYEDEGRWQMTWASSSSVEIYSGGHDGGSIISFYEHTPTGDRDGISLRARGMRYLFRNITEDQFIVEEWNASEETGAYDRLIWQALYRRQGSGAPGT